MKEEFQNLIHLQEIDTAIHKIHSRQNVIPNEILTLDEELRGNERNLVEEKEKLKETDKRRRGLEIDLDTLAESLKKHQTQLHSVKTNKEYTVLLHEIETEKEKISSVEEDILFLIEEIDKGSEIVGEKEVSVLNEKKSAEERHDFLEQEKISLEKTLEKRLTERSEIIAKMDGQIITQYERIRKGRQGLAIVEIQGTTCGGCFTALPPQTAVEVRKGSRLHTCESCGRILIWKGD
jgi:predicted  nucleic acid-binding Zn-ribbon protein